MTTYFTSDLHFGHRNIIRYSDRPYLHTTPPTHHTASAEVDDASVDAMNTDIVARWNATVSAHDDVWVLGDVAMGRIEDSLRYVSALNGTLRLVPGNHDRCWQGNRKGVQRWRQVYLDAGFDEIHDDPEPLEVAGRRVLLHHFPYSGDSHDTDRFVEWRLRDRGEWLFCGHVHERWRQHGRQINVGVDAWGGYPVALEELASLISSGPAERTRIPWERQTR